MENKKPSEFLGQNVTKEGKKGTNKKNDRKKQMSFKDDDDGDLDMEEVNISLPY